MQIIQFLVSFISTVICCIIFEIFMRKKLIRQIAHTLAEKKQAAIKAQNAGGDADEYLRLEGEIRAYDNLFK